MSPTTELSRREQEVAALVAQGLTNREIAERLFISERTAEGHVEQIRNKLGFHNRAEIAAWAARGPVTIATAPAPTRPVVAAPTRPRIAWAAAGVVGVAIVVATGVALWGGLVRLGPVAPRLVPVAGLGTAGFSGDGGPASVAQLDEPTSLGFDDQGNLYFADSTATGFGAASSARLDAGTRIRRVDRQGVIRTIAGDGQVEFPFSQSDFALSTRFGREMYVLVEPSGAIYVGGGGGQDPEWIALISLEGRIRRIAGSESEVGRGALRDNSGYTGDGGPATSARLDRPRGFARDSLGALFFTDSGNNVVRRIDTAGRIETYVGTGKRGDAPDGVEAAKGELFAPIGLALSPDGSLYIADTNNHKVRKVDHAGRLVTVAGDGTEGFAGDGGPALRARLSLPQGLAFDKAGNLYVADSGNHRVRMVATDGTITTVAGDGTTAQLASPSALAIGPDGLLYIADPGNHRIYRVER